MNQLGALVSHTVLDVELQTRFEPGEATVSEIATVFEAPLLLVPRIVIV